ncbi:isoamylase early set domain-containing protein [Thermodesulfobacteriota bacterium]
MPTKFRPVEEYRMLKKNYTKTGKFCRVTFKLSAEVNAETAALCGDFNNWDPDIHPMKRLKDGSFSTTVSMPSGQLYRFRYLLDGERWENDWEADAYISNEYGNDDSVVEV